jgi:hypothetical protein
MTCVNRLYEVPGVKLVWVKPMLDHMGWWNTCLSAADVSKDKDLIELDTRTGRRGLHRFIHKSDVITGEELAPRIPGRKSV